MKKLLFAFVLLFAGLTFAYGSGLKLEGRVHEAMSNKGIPGLAVKLIPPTASQKPEKITFTDHNGEFHFPALDSGKYLLEVYQGVTLLHREMITLNKDMRREVELRRR